MFSKSNQFADPLTGETMQDPVTYIDGITYEREVIEEWIRFRPRWSPVTGSEYGSSRLIANTTLKTEIEEWKEQQQDMIEEAKSDESESSPDAGESFQVFLISLLNETKILNVHENDTIEECMRQVSLKTGTEQHSFYLRHNGRRCSKSKTLKELNIQKVGFFFFSNLPDKSNTNCLLE